MTYVPAELIRKKRFGGTHTRDEIHFFIDGYVKDRIPDYQISAWLMAICLRGMNDEETAWLTQEMRDSGEVLDLSSLGVTVDKHSTGGVGDKTSLMIAPLVAAAGVPVPMMAGRGLGHTGGTLDKLESIPGFSVNLSFDQFRTQIGKLGCAIMGQTLELCPADRKLYALRDVTGTVDSLPLICGSIMSKKLAEGMSALVLDVKYGSGAFMKTLEDAEKLARALISIGKLSGRTVRALLTRMDEPLGHYVGNALEVQECLDILRGKMFQGEGKGYKDAVELTLELAGHMIYLGGKAKDVETGAAIAKKLLDDGSAYSKFEEMCRAQGGDLTRPLPEAKFRQEVRAEHSGYVRYLDVEKIGSASVLLGAGRKFANDRIEAGAGIGVHRRQSDKVADKDLLFTLYADDQAKLDEAYTLLKTSFLVAAEPTVQSPLIAKVIT